MKSRTATGHNKEKHSEIGWKGQLLLRSPFFSIRRAICVMAAIDFSLHKIHRESIKC